MIDTFHNRQKRNGVRSGRDVPVCAVPPAGQKAPMKKVSCSAPVTALSGTAACPLLQKACSRGREHEGTGVCALPPCDTPTMFRSRL